MAGPSPPEVFLNNSKTPEDNEMTFCHFYFTHFAYIDNAHCSKMLPWQPFVCVLHRFFGWKNEKNLNNFQDNSFSTLKCGGGGGGGWGGGVFLRSEFKFIKRFYI